MSFFHQLGYQLTKDASTALVRAIQAGRLSAPSIVRAARAMPPGKFRFLENLGRGQFNLADKVVGNIGGHAGEIVRKLPAHAYANPADAYSGLQPFVDSINKLFPTASGVPLIAPYRLINARGAFQQLGNEAIHTEESIRNLVLKQKLRTRSGTAITPNPASASQRYLVRNELPEGVLQRLGDLHGGNIGPGGQILDFSAKGLGGAPSTASRVAGNSPSSRLPIPGGYDELANMKTQYMLPQELRQNKQINDAIRRFYSPAGTPQRLGMPGIVPAGAGAATPSALRTRLQQKLPATAGPAKLTRFS